MKRLIAPIIISTCLVACAAPPSKIAATNYTHLRHSGKTCELLYTQKQQYLSKLRESCSSQTGCMIADAIGVFLVGIPITMLTGDCETDIADLKGELNAIESQQIIQGCEYTPYVETLKAKSEDCLCIEEPDEDL